MADYACYEPSTGARSDSVQAPSFGSGSGGSFKDQWYGEWSPGNVQSEDPHDEGYEVGDYGTIGVGPVPSNIERGAATHFDLGTLGR
jgi:hypothetical protein